MDSLSFLLNYSFPIEWGGSLSPATTARQNGAPHPQQKTISYSKSHWASPSQGTLTTFMLNVFFLIYNIIIWRKYFQFSNNRHINFQNTRTIIFKLKTACNRLF